MKEKILKGARDFAEARILRRAIDVYGVENQTWQLLEELFELGLSICKLHRERTRERYQNFVEERANVGIMIDQMAVAYEDLNDVLEKRAEKLSRLEERMNGEKNEP